MAAPSDPVIYNRQIEQLRTYEYPMLQDAVYLDHAGTTLYSKSLIDAFSRSMTANLFGNPHSGSLPSQLSTTRIQNIRLRLLEFLGADPLDYDLVFTANTTAAVKLVSDAFRAQEKGFHYVYHEACHTSLVGVREEATSSQCIDSAGVELGLHKNHVKPLTLFAYPAQSHVTGQRFPLSWASTGRENTDSRIYSLLDIASYVATSPISFSDPTQAPDFAVLSLYKIFGFPDLGALLVHRDAASIFASRRYFGGGTVDTVVTGKEQWHAPKSMFLHERLEDGTLPFHNIIALDAALDTHAQLFGGMPQIFSHVMRLRERLLHGLSTFKHFNEMPVCVVYSEPGSSGPVVFNLQDSAGAWVSLSEFEKLANIKKMYVRTGGLCGPGSIAALLNLRPWEIKKNFSAGFRCGASDNDIISGKPTGLIRASLGAMSTESDVDRFLEFIQEFYCQSTQPLARISASPTRQNEVSGLVVQALTVYPIKSCGGFQVPSETEWELRPEGLAWDREWCLVHRGSGQALSQKRYPRMTLFRPTFDFNGGILEVEYCGPVTGQVTRRIQVPLSMNPALFSQHGTSNSPALTSRVCGDSIIASVYTDAHINNFFSEILDVPCALARFPAGGQGQAMRTSKLRNGRVFPSRPSQPSSPSTRISPPSPPDSDSEHKQSKLLLANESPILMIYQESVCDISSTVQAKGGREIPAASFRGNIVIGRPADTPKSFVLGAYAEEKWDSMRIGNQEFAVLGGELVNGTASKI
ncbi:hypothetical protein TD95_004537 [Thielaviopsis punctulata]|uniref:Molybdenum cofactor sulfurase n=1 Tax=Thielaviopsis punctulata TaxID=72032 RepID=A0A0F4ZEI4_9PEZI|nr:hypothetical protein TD95_004537 [Thielaviopsis punctulata]